MSDHGRLGLAIVTLVMAFGTACDKSPTSASPTTTTTTPPTVTPTLQGIQMEGPTVVPPGTTAQYKVTGQISDGTTQDLTSSSTWRSSDDGVLAISETGEGRGGKPGEVVLAAEKNGKRASLQVLVLAPGTFRVTGLVSDSGMPIPGATVDVLDGSRAVMTTQTDADGIYRMYGLSGVIELRVRAFGYPEQVRAFTVADGSRYDFALPARSQSKGPYQLTIAADATACPSSGRNPWPEGLRVRTYDATVTQTGSELTVKLTEAFVVAGMFTGTVNGNTATFDIRGVSSGFYYYYSYLDRTIDLAEQLSPTSFLVISGKVTASAVGKGWSGTLRGTMGVAPKLVAGYAYFNPTCNGVKRFDLVSREP